MTPSSRITGTVLCDCTHSRGNPGFWEGLESIPANICCLPTDLESLVAIKGKKNPSRNRQGKLIRLLNLPAADNVPTRPRIL